MSIFQEFWTELIAAYRAEKAGGHAAIDSREREAEMRAELVTMVAAIRDQQAVEGIARRWVQPKSLAERESAVNEVIQYVLGTDKSK